MAGAEKATKNGIGEVAASGQGANISFTAGNLGLLNKVLFASIS